MLSNLKIVSLLVSASILSTQLSAQMTFSKVEIRNAYNKAEEGEKGRLVVDADSLRFVHKKKENMEYFSIPTEAVTEVFYSRVSGRRLKSAIGGAILFLPVALMAFSKGKKHYMTISFNDEKDIVGAVEFKLDKKNYREAGASPEPAPDGDGRRATPQLRWGLRLTLRSVETTLLPGMSRSRDCRETNCDRKQCHSPDHCHFPVRALAGFLAGRRIGSGGARVGEKIKMSVLGAAQKIGDAVGVKIDQRGAHVVPLDIALCNRAGAAKEPFSVARVDLRE